MIRADKPRVLAGLAALPFMVAACLVMLMVLSPWLGIIGPASNIFFASAGLAIAAGLVTAIIALCLLAPQPVNAGMRTDVDGDEKTHQQRHLAPARVGSGRA